jgi:methylphosphotriester-DNA--protein-cysteine methyltransferase
VPRRNRVDPWGDLHAVPDRGLFTGNRGCVVDDHERVVRHHASALWIICRTEYRGWRVALARPRRWTPLFFLDDAVGLAAGHRPCATCRRDDYTAYRDAVGRALGRSTPVLASELNDRLRAERLPRGRGLDRAGDRVVWTAAYDGLPDGTVVIDEAGEARLVLADRLLRFRFGGWTAPVARPTGARTATVLTPPTSVAALAHGFRPCLHDSARAAMMGGP